MLKIYKVQAIIQLDRGTKQSYKKSYIYKAELNLYLNKHGLPLQQHRRNYLHERSFAATKYVHLVLNYKETFLNHCSINATPRYGFWYLQSIVLGRYLPFVSRLETFLYCESTKIPVKKQQK